MLNVSFSAGTANGAIENAPITILDDLIVEGAETVVLFATTEPKILASFVEGQNRVTISILDNDGKQHATSYYHSTIA